MLKKPSISDDTIITCLYDSFGLHISQATFLPLGDVKNAIYHVTADNGAPYFLKLHQYDFNETAVTVPNFLYEQGVQQVIAPIPTTTHALWLSEAGFVWTLYPFFHGKTGFEMALSKAQWNKLGASMSGIHQTRLPAELVKRIPQEAYSPHWRNIVKAFHKEVDQKRYDDPTAASFAALWMVKQDEIQSIVQRAELLALELQNRHIQPVICHSDLHGGNVMVGADDKIAIVDWDEPILAPKERDLMFIGGGIGGIWNNDQEVKWFYEGYGQTEIDLIALAYYRYERIVADVAEYAQRIFTMRGSVQDRQKGLRLIEQFEPNNVVEIAHRSYQQLSD